jgi:hypothetical protein
MLARGDVRGEDTVVEGDQCLTSCFAFEVE